MVSFHDLAQNFMQNCPKGIHQLLGFTPSYTASKVVSPLMPLAGCSHIHKLQLAPVLVSPAPEEHWQAGGQPVSADVVPQILHLSPLSHLPRFRRNFQDLLTCQHCQQTSCVFQDFCLLSLFLSVPSLVLLTLGYCGICCPFLHDRHDF